MNSIQNNGLRYIDIGVSRRIDSIGSVKKSFSEELEKISKTEKNDTVQISGMSYEQRLEYLKELHKNTDYSNMTDAEKLRLIHSRFEENFDIWANKYGLYGSFQDTNSLHDRIVREYSSQLSDTINLREYNYEEMQQLWREALYPNHTEEEIIQSVKNKYSGDSTLDKFNTISELMDMGLCDTFSASCMLDQMSRDFENSVKQSNRFLFVSNDDSALMSMKENMAVGIKSYISEIGNKIIENFGGLIKCPEDVKNSVYDIIDILKY